MPKISIITPFYNGSRYIKKCIEGIQNQSFKDFEHIIIDDGSSDEERNFVLVFSKSFSNTKVIPQKNKGQASAVNKGIAMASGEYIAFCDQDDWWLSEKLQKQIVYLESHPEIGMVYSDAYMGDEAGNILKRTWMQSRSVVPYFGGYDECAVELFRRNFVCAPLVMLVRKKVFDSIGVMDETLRSAYDYDFLFRYLESGNIIGFIDKPLAVWRTHEGQESKNIRRAKHSQASILCHFLLRHLDFVVKHPLMVIKKISFTAGGFLFNRSRVLE
jgi:glycosyltransferase involved in cell wall biosynthesis